MAMKKEKRLTVTLIIVIALIVLTVLYAYRDMLMPAPLRLTQAQPELQFVYLPPALPIQIFSRPDFLRPSNFAGVTKSTIAVTNNATPPYVFNSTVAGKIAYGGDCSSAQTDAVSGPNTITFNALKDGLHANCTIVVSDASGNASPTLYVQPFIVDTTAPSVNLVSATVTNGRYMAGATIPVTVQFSEPVYVTGAPQLTLAVGAKGATGLHYAAGSGTATLEFDYIVAAGDYSARLDYAQTSSLDANGGSIKDAAGNDAKLDLPSPGSNGSLAGTKHIFVNAAAPSLGEAKPVPATSTLPLPPAAAPATPFEPPPKS